MRKVSYFSWKTALIMSACFIVCFAVFAPQIMHLFIPEAQTSTLGAVFFADRMSCSAADFRQFSDQLYTSGDGQRHTVCNSDIQQTGAFKYSAAYIDECIDRALRHDMDAACCGNHYASDIFRYVFAYAERIKTAGTKERGEFIV